MDLRTESKGHYIAGYVILPNHLHVLIGFIGPHSTINTIVSNGKRFLAYEITKRLKAQNNIPVLQKLTAAVTDSEEKEESSTRCLNPPLMQRNAGRIVSLIRS